MTEEKLKLRELAWHRHPVFVAVISFILAGIMLHWIQTSTSKSAQLRERKIAILEDVSLCLAKADRVYRDIQVLGLAREQLPIAEWDDLQDKFLQDIDQAYELFFALEPLLLVYFPAETAYDLLRKARTELKNTIETSIAKLKAASGPLELISDQEFDNQAARFVRIQLKLAKAIGFPDLEEKRRLPNH